jgi:hypothetical protein
MKNILALHESDHSRWFSAFVHWQRMRQTGSTPELSYPPPPERPAFTPAEPPPKGEWRARASAVQEEIFPAEMACDGKADTRWSSPAADPQWVEIDLGRAATICGLTILWETAYASEYNVAVSLDGNQWTPVFTNQYGDGQTDDIFFRPVSARLIRITGTKRGTGWGIQFGRVDVKGPGERVIAIAPPWPVPAGKSVRWRSGHSLAGGQWRAVNHSG